MRKQFYFVCGILVGVILMIVCNITLVNANDDTHEEKMLAHYTGYGHSYHGTAKEKNAARQRDIRILGDRLGHESKKMGGPGHHHGHGHGGGCFISTVQN